MVQSFTAEVRQECDSSENRNQCLTPHHETTEPKAVENVLNPAIEFLKQPFLQRTGTG